MRYVKWFYIYMQGFNCWLTISNSMDTNTFNYLVLVQCDQIIFYLWGMRNASVGEKGPYSDRGAGRQDVPDGAIPAGTTLVVYSVVFLSYFLWVWPIRCILTADLNPIYMFTFLISWGRLFHILPPTKSVLWLIYWRMAVELRGVRLLSVLVALLFISVLWILYSVVH